VIKTLGFTVEKVAALTGLSENRVRYWARTGVQEPSLLYEPGIPYGYLYSFRDLVALRTLKNLQDEYGFTLQQLRKIGSKLRERDGEPWSTYRFFLYGDKLAFSDAEAQMLVSASQPGQALITEIDVDLVAVRSEMESAAQRLQERTSDDVGRIDQTRLVFQSKPVIAGTRIPTATIWHYYEDGADLDRIIELYPFLEPEDVGAALCFEAERRTQAAS
jgi:uncharacterized protein (DUF433 family)